jgi:hypothetical protein
MAYRVFICHSYDHRGIYYELIQKLNDTGHFQWRNVSVPYDMRFGDGSNDVDNDELRQEISQKIQSCNAFLVLTKPVASRRRWLQWEILYAKGLGKPIIGVARRRNDSVSSFVKQHADDIVDTWRIDHIINAIKIYGNEYRRLESRSAPPTSSTLPSESPDVELAAEPTPPVPDNLREIDMIETYQAELPRDVLFRDLGAYVPDARTSAARLPPRWWWPFSRNGAGA